MRNKIFTTILCVLASVLGSCSLDDFLYNTRTVDEYVLPETTIPASNRETVTIQSEGETLYGFFVRQHDSLRQQPHPVVIYNHGNRYNLQEYWDRVELLYDCGFDVFIYDYRGFGKSTGSSSEAGLSADAIAAWDYVRGRPDVDTNWIVEYGYSLGGVPASVAATHGKPRTLIMESTFASGESLVRSGTLIDIPGGYLLEGEYDNIGRVRNVTCPILYIHGTEDAFVPVDNSRNMYNATMSPKLFYEVPGASHENVPATMGRSTYINVIMAFVRAN